MISNSKSILEMVLVPQYQILGQFGRPKKRIDSDTLNKQQTCVFCVLTQQSITKIKYCCFPHVFYSKTKLRAYILVCWVLNASASYVFWSSQMSLDQGGLKIVERLPIKPFFSRPKSNLRVGWSRQVRSSQHPKHLQGCRHQHKVDPRGNSLTLFSLSAQGQ